MEMFVIYFDYEEIISLNRILCQKLLIKLSTEYFFNATIFFFASQNKSDNFETDM